MANVTCNFANIFYCKFCAGTAVRSSRPRHTGGVRPDFVTSATPRLRKCPHITSVAALLWCQ